MKLICSKCSTVQEGIKPRSRSRKACAQCNGSMYTLLAQNLEFAFSIISAKRASNRVDHQGIRDLGNGWWLFCAEPDWTFKAYVSYEDATFAERTTSTMNDMWLPTDYAISPSEFRFSLQDFLQQFHSIARRWGWHYEPFTEKILHSSAQWQESHSLKSTLVPTNTHSEATVVAASLRCLIISNEINRISCNWPGFRHDERFLRLADLERNPRGQDTGIGPSIDVWRLEHHHQLPDSVPRTRETLPQMLQRTFQATQCLLNRGRPQDWPALFYVLCILSLVLGNIDAQLWTDAAHRAEKETRKALRQLCRLFHRTTSNMQPLSSDLDLKGYAALVDDNELAVEHYRRMNQMWLDSSDGEDHEEDAEDLWRNLDNFAYGMV